MITRRAALAAAGGAVLAPVAVARAEVVDDAELVRRLVLLEQLSAFAYAAAASANVLERDDAELCAQLATHESEHGAALATQLEALGGRRPRPPADLPAASQLARSLAVDGLEAALRDGEAFLGWAQRLEHESIRRYVDACRRALDVGLIQTLASVLAAEGQHLGAVRRHSGQRPVHKPFLPER